MKRCPICGKNYCAHTNLDKRGVQSAKAPVDQKRTWGPIGQFPYTDYREQQADYTDDVRGVFPHANFLLNRQGWTKNPSHDLYTVAPDHVTPYLWQRETWLPNPPKLAPQIHRMGGQAPGQLSIFKIQELQAGMRAWPFLKNKIRDVLFSEEDD